LKEKKGSKRLEVKRKNRSEKNKEISAKKWLLDKLNLPTKILPMIKDFLTMLEALRQEIQTVKTITFTTNLCLLTEVQSMPRQLTPEPETRQQEQPLCNSRCTNNLFLV